MKNDIGEVKFVSVKYMELYGVFFIRIQAEEEYIPERVASDSHAWNLTYSDLTRYHRG